MYFYCFPSTDHHISFFYYTEKQFTYLCPKIFFSLFQVFIFRRNWWCFRHIQELLFPGISREDLPSVQGYSLQQLASCFSNKHQGINRKRNVLVSGQPKQKTNFKKQPIASSLLYRKQVKQSLRKCTKHYNNTFQKKKYKWPTNALRKCIPSLVIRNANPDKNIPKIYIKRGGERVWKQKQEVDVRVKSIIMFQKVFI